MSFDWIYVCFFSFFPNFIILRWYRNALNINAKEQKASAEVQERTISKAQRRLEIRKRLYFFCFFFLGLSSCRCMPINSMCQCGNREIRFWFDFYAFIFSLNWTDETVRYCWHVIASNAVSITILSVSGNVIAEMNW